MNNGTDNLSKILKALADSNRLGILIAIGSEARSVTEIVRATGLSQTLVSFHLRALRDAEIVTTERNGPFIFYSLSKPALLKILSELSGTVNSGATVSAKKKMPVLPKGRRKHTLHRGR